MWLWQNFENWMQLKAFHQKLQNQEFGWLWKRWGRRVFVESMIFKREAERNDHMLYYEQVFGNVFERRESKCYAVLMKYYRKVKGEQMITLQMVQQLKPKTLMLYQDNYFVVSVKLNFC